MKKRFTHPTSCTDCHLDHQILGGKPPYLNSPEPGLCVQCHSGLAAKHQRQPVEGSRCTLCHDPHSSRLRGLVYEYQHGPFAGRHCDECHAEPRDGKVTINGGKIKELCLTCHVVVGEEVADSRSAHRKLVCTDCHTPHTSSWQPHLKMPREKLCVACHKAKAEKFQH